MPHRKLDIAARAAGFAMVNQDSFENQTEFFVRLDKDGSDISKSSDLSRSDEQPDTQRNPAWSWL